VESARCLREHPELETRFIKGDVSSCTIASAAKAIKAEKTSVNEIIGKSAREVQSPIAKVAPMEKPRERIKEIKTRNISIMNDNSRYIPASVKREVLKMDNHQCSYVSSETERCTATHFLQFDHVTPFGIGGKSNFENIRLLCAAHNKDRISITFGRKSNSNSQLLARY